jgi:hypothetical protein
MSAQNTEMHRLAGCATSDDRWTFITALLTDYGSTYVRTAMSLLTWKTASITRHYIEDDRLSEPGLLNRGELMERVRAEGPPAAPPKRAGRPRGADWLPVRAPGGVAKESSTARGLTDRSPAFVHQRFARLD